MKNNKKNQFRKLTASFIVIEPTTTIVLQGPIWDRHIKTVTELSIFVRAQPSSILGPGTVELQHNRRCYYEKE